MPVLTDNLTRGLAAVSVVVGLPPAARRATPASLPFELQNLTGLIDTGTSVTGIDPLVVARLGLKTIGKTRRPVQGPFAPAGGVNPWRYRVWLTLVNPNNNPRDNLIRKNLEVLEVPASGAHVLVGTDVLMHCDFNYSGLGGTFSLSW
ncbi:MAG TPA: hypothetical protein VG013_27205 [Gemmataceae bacterium]|jgi:hypothetical protein|nr:hypothetical protein [Gemmataceae bacterium]